MRIVRFQYRGGEKFGLLKDDHVRLLQGRPFSGIKTSGVSVALAKVELLAPVVPTKVVAVGLNYRDHAKELGMEIPRQPIIFLKPSSSVIGINQPIIYPATSEQVEYEAELAIVIGKQARMVEEDEVEHFVLGYTCANDVTARDLQRTDGQWTRAKGFDSFCPIGPWIATDCRPDDLQIVLKVNGRIKQSSTTNRMIFNTRRLVAFVSSIMTLCPGDIILTGTPPGVGPLEVGDTVAVEIENIGRLQNQVVAEELTY